MSLFVMIPIESIIIPTIELLLLSSDSTSKKSSQGLEQSTINQIICRIILWTIMDIVEKNEKEILAEVQ